MTPVFAEHTVCAFLADVPQHRDRLSALWAHLSPEERARAARFHLSADRERFVVGRGLLREILASYLQVAPGDLAFSYNRQGKPALAGCSPVEFNIAHAHEVVALAFTLGRKVGIDVERIDRAIDVLLLAERFFTAEEAASLRALDEPDRSAAFFRDWTRKEAFVKAQGEGLGRSLEPIGAERAHWSTVEVPCVDGYVATLCAQAGAWRLEVRTLQGDWQTRVKD
jgi:4'-phosphopantetheinyl transferase